MRRYFDDAGKREADLACLKRNRRTAPLDPRSTETQVVTLDSQIWDEVQLKITIPTLFRRRNLICFPRLFLQLLI